MSGRKKVHEEVVPGSVATEEDSSAKVAAGDGVPNETIEPVSLEDRQMAVATDLPCSSNNATAVGMLWECDKNGNIFCKLQNSPANKD